MVRPSAIEKLFVSWSALVCGPKLLQRACARPGVAVGQPQAPATPHGFGPFAGDFLLRLGGGFLLFRVSFPALPSQGLSSVGSCPFSYCEFPITYSVFPVFSAVCSLKPGPYI